MTKEKARRERPCMRTTTMNQELDIEDNLDVMILGNDGDVRREWNGEGDEASSRGNHRRVHGACSEEAQMVSDGATSRSMSSLRAGLEVRSVRGGVQVQAACAKEECHQSEVDSELRIESKPGSQDREQARMRRQAGRQASQQVTSMRRITVACMTFWGDGAKGEKL
nr:hypothetical protein CFP56_67045 [Quercus suber]